MMTNGFAHTPPYTVAHHGLSDGARQRKADMRSVRLGLANAKRREQRVRVARALIVNPSEIFGSQQADTFRKTSDGELPLGADRKFCTPPGTPAGKHGAAVLRRHPGAKAMRLGAMTVILLKSTFGHWGSTI